jgi:glycerophosphoryl diester phosphodiesterase
MAVALAAPPVSNNPFLAPKSRPLVVGHRGVPALHQENTLAGFRRAVALGIDAVELDVRLTRDLRAVVFHDSNTQRMTGTRGAIADMTWDEVAALRVQATIGSPGRAMRYDAEERIPLLAEVLAEVGRAVAINIDIKPRWFGDDISQVVASEVAAAGVADRVLVTSYDPRKLRDAILADPALAVGYCWSSSLFGAGRYLVDRMLAGLSRVRAVGADHDLLDRSSVQRLRATGLAVGAHVLFPLHGRSTPPDEVARLFQLGVDWIEADDPERVRDELA